MRRMAFAATIPQVRARTKTVTRRLGWLDLEVGERLQAIDKGRGLKVIDGVRRTAELLAVIRVVSIRRERLDAIVKQGAEELAREGFPDMDPWEFVTTFAQASRCAPMDHVSRIEFAYEPEAGEDTRDFDTMAQWDLSGRPDLNNPQEG